jgi:hypothetical protein
MANIQTTVDASPVKEFFVSMLTRDISLEDAILDLLDNCVDGILRSSTTLKGLKPYSGRWANIEFDSDRFSITDNCGGIPEDLFDYAFLMGSPKEMTGKRPSGSLGSYGIGMKRAIFKIGRQCSILTSHSGKAFEFLIEKDWFDKEKYWKIPYQRIRKRPEYDGTTIEIKQLNDVIAKTFGADRDKFESDLMQEIANRYSFIVGKGFRVKVNKKPISPHIVKFAFAEGEKEVVKPYIFTGQEDGITVFLTVGFTGPLIEGDELQYSPKHSGWSVVCNDRTIVYGDKTEHTGWGSGGVPSYHPQYNPIAGVVEFHSEDPSKLPTNTAKNKVDFTPLYIRILDKMREGVRPFIDYTNKWKGDELLKKGKRHIEDAHFYDLNEVKEKIQTLPLSSVSKPIAGKQLKPILPSPPKKEPEEVKISFKRKMVEVKKVSSYFFSREDAKPSEVGERCFVEILKEARR